MMTASTTPMLMATMDVARNSNTVLMPREPSLAGSPIDATPLITVRNTIGTISMRIRRMNRSPSHKMLSAPGPQNDPTITPSAMAPTILFHNAILNQAARALAMNFSLRVEAWLNKTWGKTIGLGAVGPVQLS